MQFYDELHFYPEKQSNYSIDRVTPEVHLIPKSYLQYRKSFSKLYTRYLYNIHLDYEAFWEANRKNILGFFGFFFQISKNESKEYFYRIIETKIRKEFEKKIVISSDFQNLLEEKYYFAIYFILLRRFILFFFEKENIKNYSGECLYEAEIDDYNTYTIKIKIFLPFEDYDVILDHMEEFLIEQESFLKTYLLDYTNNKKILEQYKKTYFIFKSAI